MKNQQPILDAAVLSGRDKFRAQIDQQRAELGSISRIPTKPNRTDRVLRVLLNPNDRLAKNQPLCLVLLVVLFLAASAF